MKCRRIISEKSILCEVCEIFLPFTHFEFDGHNVLARKCRTFFPIENAYALFYYIGNSIIQRSIHYLKYGNREGIGNVFAKYFIEKNAKLPKGINTIVIVPIHENKRQQRGYNQLQNFAKVVSEHYNLPIEENLLRRCFYSKAQVKNSKKKRESTEEYFLANKEINDTHFLLIDDVYTTGSTLSSVAWGLLKAGVNNKVSILVMGINFR